MSQTASLNLISLLGRRSLNYLLYIIDLVVFVMAVMRSWRNRGGLFNRASRAASITQLIFSGIDALPTITILALAVGLSVTTQLIFAAQVFGQEADVASLLANLVALEFGSLLTAIVMIGRSGSAIAVDLGNMSLNREVEGLELLGIDVHAFFVSPRLIGMVIAQLVLAIYFSAFSLVTGITLAALLESTSNFKYLFAVVSAFEPLDLLLFFIKNLLFGLVIGANACLKGLSVGQSVTQVPQVTQKAIVNSLVMVFVLDGVFV
ncbi:ABC transporter permease, partial [Candidatus Endoriftia persephone str. Guaymas]|nr:ABC transporter permease [Candidatus Endoriftia persephone str. Guaymas]